MIRSYLSRGVALVALLGGGASAAFAEIPAASLTAITTEVTADVASVATFAFGLLLLVVGLGIGIKLVKRFANKAT